MDIWSLNRWSCAKLMIGAITIVVLRMGRSVYIMQNSTFEVLGSA